MDTYKSTVHVLVFCKHFGTISMIGASLARPRVHDRISGQIFDLQEYIFLSYAPCAYRYMYYKEILLRKKNVLG